MGLMSFFTNVAETRELNVDPDLKTRYYRTKYDIAKNTIMDYAKKNEYIVKNIDEKHREIFLQTTRFHIIISIVQITAIETAVDIKVQTYRIIGLGKSKRIILDLYSYLNDKLDFKGVSLHP